MNIQIMKIYKESFHNVRSHKGDWMRVAYGPVLIWLLGAILLGVAFVSGGHSFEMHKAFLGEPYTPTEGTAFLTFAHVVYSITYFIAITSLYINGYRYAILQEGGDSLVTLNLNMRFVRMVLYSILLAILGIIYVGLAAGILIGVHALFANTGINIMVGILLVLYAYYLIVRLSLFPVMIAMDQSAPMKTSWRLMKGNVLRLVGLTLLVALTILLIGIIGGAIVGLLSMFLIMISPALSVLGILLGLIFAVLMVLLGWAVMSKALGLVYLELGGLGGTTESILPTA